MIRVVATVVKNNLNLRALTTGFARKVLTHYSIVCFANL